MSGEPAFGKPMESPPVEDIIAALPRRIADLPERWAAETPDAPAVSDPDGSFTYRRFQETILAAGRALADHGVRGGDRVMVINENGLAVAALIFAIGRCEAWPVIVNGRLTAREIDAIRDHCTPRRILYTVAVSPEAAAHAGRHGAAPAAIGGLDGLAIGPLAETEPEPVHDDPTRQIAALVYTSGTTGAPKGVMLSHRAVLFTACGPGSQRPLGPGDYVYSALPVAHVFGLTSTFLRAIYGGAHVHLQPRFDAADILRALAEDGVTVFQGVPAMWAKLLEYADTHGIEIEVPDIKSTTIGGAIVDADLKVRVEEAFGLPLINGYGMTECASTISRSRPKDRGAIVTGGLPMPGVEVRVVDEQGTDLPRGGTGELWLRTPNIMNGYYRDQVATAEVLTPDGWFKTGDLGKQNEDGDLFIVDRKKELIIRSGFNVYPAEVEAVLNEHPAVTLSGVVGRTVAGNEEVIAYVQTAPGSAAAPQDILAFAAERLAPYKRPAELHILDALPAAATGKILKRTLREMARSKTREPGGVS